MGEYRTFVHGETGERVMADPDVGEGLRMSEKDSGFSEMDETSQSGRIVETADPDKAARIGYQNPSGNTQVSTADAAAHAQGSLTDEDVDDEDADVNPNDNTEDDELEGDEFDTFGEKK